MDGWYAENAGAIFCLVQGFMTMKMAAFQHALRELSQEACTRQAGIEQNIDK